MSWIDIVWPVMGGTSLALGLIHLLIWSRQRDAYPHLLLSISAAVVGAMAIFELLGMRAEAPREYAELLRFTHLLFATLVVLLATFVHQRFHSGRVWLAVVACSLRVGSLLPNFLTGVNLNFQSIERLDQLNIWGGGTVAVPVGDPNPWMLLGQLSNVFLVAFILDTMIRTWRRGDQQARRGVVLVCGSLVLFIALPSVWSALVVLGQLRAPMTVNFAFLGVILVISHELSRDVLRADELARNLAESEARLRESEQRLRLAASGGGLGLWTWDLERNDSWFTGLGYDLLGLAPGESMGWEKVLEQVEPEHRAALEQARVDALQTGAFACEFRLRKPDGGSRWVLAKGSLATSSPDSPAMMRGVLLDITGRRQAEDRFRLIVETAPQAMLAVDGEGLDHARQLAGSASPWLLQGRTRWLEHRHFHPGSNTATPGERAGRFRRQAKWAGAGRGTAGFCFLPRWAPGAHRVWAHSDPGRGAASGDCLDHGYQRATSVRAGGQDAKCRARPPVARVHAG